MTVQPPGALNPSDIVFLFGHLFAEPKEEGRSVPCSDVKVGVKSLVTTMMAAAFVSLSDDGLIALAKGQRKRLFFKSDASVVTKLQQPEGPQEGIEGALLSTIGEVGHERLVGDVVRQMIGRSAMDPFSVVIALAAEHAHKAGYFREDPNASTMEKFFAGRTLPVPVVPICERIVTLADQAEVVKRKLNAYQANSGEIFNLVCKDVQRSVRAAYMST